MYYHPTALIGVVGAPGGMVKMRQVVQTIGAGGTQVWDVPCPTVRPGCLLIRTRVTLISAGTERATVQSSQKSLLSKALAQPKKALAVLEQARAEGALAPLDLILDRPDDPIELGYCNVGTVLAVGAGVEGYAIGDRVLSNGKHAEVVCVPVNLCAKVPDAVSDDEAAFGVLGSIALQGIRLAAPTLGETFLVSGLGLIGLLAVQLLKANGVRVLAADFHPGRLAQARAFGAETVHLGEEDLLGRARTFTDGQGIDGVLITAATSSPEPIRQAAHVCRKRGRIVLVGVAGLQLAREDFYEKELTFQVSCSYGPGRYDPTYEEQGRDYPLAFVRWTEQRNFTAILELMAKGQLAAASLVTHRYPLNDAKEAFAVISGREPSLGVLLTNDANPTAERLTTLKQQTLPPAPSPAGVFAAPANSTTPVVAVIGPGGFASKMLLPAFQQAGVSFRWMASRGGVSAAHAARKFQATHATTDVQQVFDDPAVQAVIIATRHDSHADLVCRGLAAGKGVFVEKPLCLTRDELARVEAAVVEHPELPLMVGFNRRFAPHTVQLAKLLRGVEAPKAFVMTVNAGMVPPGHWTHDPQIGGGRMIGEGCHFVDLLRFLAGSPIVTAQALQLGAHPALPQSDDVLTATLRFADGSVGTIHYLGNGHRSLAKERLEVFCNGRVLQLDNFLTLRGFGWPGFRKQTLWRIDKGHKAEAAAFVQTVKTGGPAPIPFAEIAEVTRVTFDLVDAAVHGAKLTATETAVVPFPSATPLARCA